MTHPIHTVDVFTQKALAGNQLAVVLDAQDIPEELMQRIAREMNLSETTFVLPPDDPAHAARVRIFTPAEELPFAGHPTVGTAWVLVANGLVPGGALEFTLEEAVGPIAVRGVETQDGLLIWMAHPAVSFGGVFEDRAAVSAALGVRESDLVEGVPLQVAKTGVPFLFVALKDARAVDASVTNQQRLLDIYRGGEPYAVYLFAALGHDRLYSRMFAPHVMDIPEDPATGAAAGPLGAFAVKYGLVPRAPKVAIMNEQGTKMGRQSFIHIELEYGESEDIPARIEVGGAVRPVISGTLSDFD
ncbi:MAG: PhzF family phenazine biosynthesis protein [Candidatus Dormiibacterota bacterium]